MPAMWCLRNHESICASAHHPCAGAHYACAGAHYASAGAHYACADAQKQRLLPCFLSLLLLSALLPAPIVVSVSVTKHAPLIVSCAGTHMWATTSCWMQQEAWSWGKQQVEAAAWRHKAQSFAAADSLCCLCIVVLSMPTASRAYPPRCAAGCCCCIPACTCSLQRANRRATAGVRATVAWCAKCHICSDQRQAC